ncbi:MAG: PAS domain S-box protein [Negativicutes bacterium]|nr:PAS domain S-box protein [Negativicutes bacterium]
MKRFLRQTGKISVKTVMTDLRWLIVLLSIAVIAGIWSFVLLQVKQDYQTEVTNIYRANSNLAKAFEEHVRRTVDDVDLVLRAVAGEYERVGRVNAAIESYLALARRNQAWNAMSIFDDQGGYIVSSAGVAPPELKVFDRRYFQFHIPRQTGGPYVSEPVQGRISGKPSINISHRIDKPDGSFGGVVAVALDPQQFTSFYQQMDLGEMHSVVLVGLDGIVRARYISGSINYGQNIGDSMLLQLSQQKATGNFENTSVLTDTVRLQSYRVMPDYGLVVNVAVDKAEALREFENRKLGHYTAALVWTLVTLLLGGLLTRQVGRQYKAQRELRLSEQRFSQVTEQAAEWIWEVDKDGLYTYASPAVEQILGYRPAELVGEKHYYDLFGSDCREELRQMAAAAFARQDIIRGLENANIHKTGRMVMLETNGTPILDENGDLVGYRGVDIDVTERRQATEKIRESEEKYRTIIDKARDIIFTLQPNGQILEVNAAAVRIYGYTYEEFADLNIYDIRQPDEANMAEELLDKANREGILFETTHRRKDGSSFPVEVGSAGTTINGKRVLLSVIRDISDRKLAEKELLESRERFEALLKQSSEAIIVYDIDTLRIVEVNDATIRMFGYTEAELLTMKATDIIILSDEELLAVLDMIRTRGGFPSNIARYRHKDSRVIFAERSGSLINYQGKQLSLVTYRDITAERELQQKVQEEVGLAGIVQKTMLAGDYRDDNVTIRTIYQPVHLVSGDYYGYAWSRDGQVLNGFMLDVTGHGMSTALLTAAISAVLKAAMDETERWSAAKLEELNDRLAPYLPEGSFAAIMVFSLDFEHRLLTCVSAGINYFLAATADNNGWVVLPGSYLGVLAVAHCQEMTLPFLPGESFYFVTDGITDHLSPKEAIDVRDFVGTVKLLREIAANPTKKDDCSALCIQIGGADLLTEKFEYQIPDDRQRVRPSVLLRLAELAGTRIPSLEVALGEAVTNGMQAGTWVGIRLKKIGSRIVIRVRDNGIGFPGNEMVSRVQAAGARQIFQERLQEDNGRGIPIMISLMDRVIYSKIGNEIMLVKKLQGGGEDHGLHS